MLDGASRLDELVDRAVGDGQTALGITDHGNMYGVIDFYKECTKRGIKHRIARKGIESSSHLGKQRWVVERTFAWLSKFRRLAVRYERRIWRAGPAPCKPMPMAVTTTSTMPATGPRRC